MKSICPGGRQVVFKRGENAYVNSNTNFVSVENDKAVVQVAFNIPSAGPNGVGGVTVEGGFSKYDVKKTKRGDIVLSMAVMGTGISATVDITLYEGSNKATVNILPNLNSNRITLEGRILPLSQSRVFKGRSL